MCILMVLSHEPVAFCETFYFKTVHCSPVHKRVRVRDGSFQIRFEREKAGSLPVLIHSAFFESSFLCALSKRPKFPLNSSCVSLL